MEKITVNQTISINDLQQYGFQRANTYDSGQYTYTVPAYIYHGKVVVWLEVRIFAKTSDDLHYAIHIDCKTNDGNFYSPYYHSDNFSTNLVLKHILRQKRILITKLRRDHILWEPNKSKEKNRNQAFLHKIKHD